MSLYDLVTRTDAILKKYEKFATMDKKEKTSKGGDVFTEELEAIQSEVERAISVATEISQEKNRALAAQKNAEIRKLKAELLDEAIPSVQKKARKGRNKQLIAERERKVAEMIDAIVAIPDGMSVAASKRPYRYGGATGTKKSPITLNMSNIPSTSDGYHDATQETERFDAEWRKAKLQQDDALDRIERGVQQLGDMASQAHDELNRQDPVISDIDQQLDKVTKQLQNNNMRLKGVMNKMRTARNFCIDAVLICIILGIGAYIFSIFQ